MNYDFHNPDSLTSEQVGEGYRLLLTSELNRHREPSREIQCWGRAHQVFMNGTWRGSDHSSTYRVPLATWPLPEAGPRCDPGPVGAAGPHGEPTDWIPWHVKRITELKTKLQAAEARLAQLEWVPFSERAPTLIKHESPGGPYWYHPDHPLCQDGKVLWEEPSETPQTDAFMETLQGHSDSWETFAQKVEDFSCELERQLNAASEIVRRLAEWSKKYPRQQVHSFSAKVDEQLIEIENAAKVWLDGHNISDQATASTK